MGRAGKTPLTADECKRRGFDAKAKQRSGAPSPEAKAPKCPAWLKGAARKEWAALVPMLDAMGCVGEVDQIAIALGCDSIAEYRGALTLKDKLAANAVVMKFCREFGMTPAARAGMGIAMHTAKAEKDKRAKYTEAIAGKIGEKKQA